MSVSQAGAHRESVYAHPKVMAATSLANDDQRRQNTAKKQVERLPREPHSCTFARIARGTLRGLIRSAGVLASVSAQAGTPCCGSFRLVKRGTGRKDMSRRGEGGCRVVRGAFGSVSRDPCACREPLQRFPSVSCIEMRAEYIGSGFRDLGSPGRAALQGRKRRAYPRYRSFSHAAHMERRIPRSASSSSPRRPFMSASRSHLPMASITSNQPP